MEGRFKVHRLLIPLIWELLIIHSLLLLQQLLTKLPERNRFMKKSVIDLQQRQQELHILKIEILILGILWMII